MLREMLSANLFQWMLIFARIGAGIMFLPGFNSSMISARVRLLFALILSFLLMPVLSGKLVAAPASPVGLFLLLAGEIFVTNTHHLMLHALVDSYSIYSPGQPLPMDDLAQTLTRTLSAAALMGLRLSAPLLVFTITMNTGLGLMNRLMPNMHVFFVAQPLQIIGGLTVLMICLPAIMMLFMDHLAEGIGSFLNFG
jgi:flagellar biosynthetic protein FliR